MGIRSVLLVTLLGSLGAAVGEAQTTPKAKVAPSEAPRTVHVIAGVVTSVEPSAGLVAVRESVPSAPEKGRKPVRRSVSLVVNAETMVILGKAPAALSELKVGDYVVARYAETPQGALALTLRAADAIVQAAPPASASSQPAEAPGKEGDHR